MSELAPPDVTATDAADAAPPAALDLDMIEADLADVEIALARLDSGEYWRDEVTGEPLDDALLAHRPTARRAIDPA
jgi:RNA polymerase-binding transcription factor DksA